MVFDAHLLGKIAGHKAEVEVGVSLEFRIAENALIYLCIVFHQCMLVAGDGAVENAVVSKFVGDTVGYFAFLQDVQEHCPVLAFTDRGHVEFTELGSVVNAGETTNLVVVLHVFQREGGGHFHHAVQL